MLNRKTLGKRKLASLLSTPLLLSGIAVAAPIALATPASAAPHGCGFREINIYSISSTCHYGPGEQRAKIRCTDGINGDTYIVYGPWKQWYQNSVAVCGAPQRTSARFIETQVRV
ncbi:hypothetical protein [Streptomyces europaeiscabiei]|uniref:hypothetical protein n=1 Tax=Streptomyces europaeiscabiei TaxID=146819 RepID=UPI002E28FE17|nr:hypothetical protein [Streptomyces europaeiscabiei]